MAVVDLRGPEPIGDVNTHHPECQYRVLFERTGRTSGYCDCKGMPFRPDGSDEYAFICRRSDVAANHA